VLSAGRIEQVGSPLTLYEYPDNLFVACFIGSPGMNLIDGEVMQTSPQCATVRLLGSEVIRCNVDASSAQVGDKVKLGVRPEHLRAGMTDNALRTQVTFVESLGSITYAYCSNPGSADVLTAAIDGETRVHGGDTLLLGVPPEWAYLFDAQGRAFRRHSTPEQRRAV
jgi:multiple sugar transport system ATP-binding protein